MGAQLSAPGKVESIANQGATGGCSHASYALYTGGSADTEGLHFYIFNGTSIAVSPAATDAMWDGNWHMAAGTYDGTTVRLYVDGTEVGSGTPTTGDIGYGLALSNDFVIGNTNDTSCVENTNWSGDLDEVRVYDRALSPTEIQQLANPSATTPPELSNGTPPPGGGGGQPPQQNGSPPPPPFPSFRGPRTLKPDLPMLFDASATTGATTDVWDLNGDGKGDVSCPASQPYLSVNYDRLSNLHRAAHAAGFTSANLHIFVFGGGGSATATIRPLLDPNLTLPAQTAQKTPEVASCSSSIAALINPHFNPNPGTCKPETVTLDIAEIKGCFRFATRRDEVPAADRGLWDEFQATSQSDYNQCLANTRQDAANGEFVDPFGCQSYFFNNTRDTLLLSDGTVTVNGLTFTPRAGHQIVISEYLQRIVSDAAVAKFGPMRFAPLPSLNNNPANLFRGFSDGPIDVDLHPVSVPDWLTGPGRPSRAHELLSFDGTKDLPRIGGFSIDGQIDLAIARRFDHRYSVGRVRLALPGDFAVFEGQPPVGEVHLIADNSGGPSLDTVDLSLPYAELPPVTLSDVHFHYDRAGQPGPPFNCDGDFWKATANVFIGTDDPNEGQAGFSLSDQPPFPPNAPQNGIGFCGRSFSHAGGSVTFGGPIPKPEVFPGVDLDEVGLAVQLNPALVHGQATLDVADLSQVHGDFLSVFATHDNPYNLSTADGPGFARIPASDGDTNHRGQRLLTGTTLAAGGAASLTLPGLASVPLGGAYALYSFPDFVAFGGNATAILPGLRLEGQVDGQMSVHDARFNVEGKVSACFLQELLGTSIGCGVTATAWVSDNGVVACIGDPTDPNSHGPHPGAGGSLDIFRARGRLDIWLIDGCKPSKYWDVSIGSSGVRAAQAGGLTFAVARGERDKNLRLVGADASPRVSVRSPDGETISTDEGGYVNHGTLSIVRADGNLTYIGVDNGVPGRYTITPLPGSTRLTGLALTRPGGTELKARVTRSGRARVLYYRVGNLVGRKVTFFERGTSTYRLLGSAAASKGTIRFTPGAGPGGRREIVARSIVEGVPAADQVVAHFSAPSRVRPGSVRHVRVHRRGSALTVSWRPASDATAYGIVVMQRNGVQRVAIVKARRHSVRFANVSRAWGGVVTVTARGPTDQWDPRHRGAARFRALARPFTVLRDFRQLGRRHRRAGRAPRFMFTL